MTALFSSLAAHAKENAFDRADHTLRNRPHLLETLQLLQNDIFYGFPIIKRCKNQAEITLLEGDAYFTEPEAFASLVFYLIHTQKQPYYL